MHPIPLLAALLPAIVVGLITIPTRAVKAPIGPLPLDVPTKVAMVEAVTPTPPAGQGAYIGPNVCQVVVGPVTTLVVIVRSESRRTGARGRVVGHAPRFAVVADLSQPPIPAVPVPVGRPLTGGPVGVATRPVASDGPTVEPATHAGQAPLGVVIDAPVRVDGRVLPPGAALPLLGRVGPVRATTLAQPVTRHAITP